MERLHRARSVAMKKSMTSTLILASGTIAAGAFQAYAAMKMKKNKARKKAEEAARAKRGEEPQSPE